MTRFASLILSIFLTINLAQASDERTGDQAPRAQVFTEANGRTFIPTMEQDAEDMRSRILGFLDELDRIGEEGVRRGVTSGEAIIQAEKRFKDDVLMCSFRQLRGMAYERLSLRVVDLDNFALAYSYALDIQDERAARLYQSYKRIYQRLADQCRPNVNENDAQLKRAMNDTLKRIDEIEKEERARHQRPIAEPINPQHDYHPLEIKRLKQMESEVTLKTLTGVHNAIVNVGKIALFVFLVYHIMKAVAFMII